VAYAVVLKPAAVRALRKLPEDIRRRVAGRIDALRGDPRPPGAEAIQGARNLYRIRVGDDRVIYQVENKALVLLVVHIGHRREVYRRLGG
jgi:mRNA interferase RelE/StbE